MYTLKKQSRKESSRLQVKIKEVRDGVLILPDNKFRVIAKVNPLNFELKSAPEQDIITDNYRDFLNSLPCNLQILLRIRELDLDDYLDGFKASTKSEKDSVYKEQAQAYRDFVKQLVSDKKVLSRNFYIVIPLDLSEGMEFGSVKETLSLNFEIIEKNLGRLGIHIQQLTSLEILNLFYSFYNPEKSKFQPVTIHTLGLLRDFTHIA